jgi:hypothetical protein
MGGFGLGGSPIGGLGCGGSPIGGRGLGGSPIGGRGRGGSIPNMISSMRHLHRSIAPSVSPRAPPASASILARPGSLSKEEKTRRTVRGHR